MRGVLLVAVVVLALVPASAAAAPPDDTGICEGRSNGVVVGAIQGERTVSTDDRLLYPGTTVYVAFCIGFPRDTNEWELEDHPGIENVTAVENVYYRLTVTDDADDVALPSLVSGDVTADGGFTIDVQRGPTVTSGLTDRTIRFGSDNASAYRRAERRYLNASENVRATAERLNERAIRINNSDGTAMTLNGTAVNETLTRLNRTQRQMQRNASTVERLLFARATSGLPGSTAATQTLEALESHQRETNNRVAASVDAYGDALDTVASDARKTILGFFGGGVLGGLVVGALAGGYLPYSKGKDVDDFREHTSRMEYDRSVVYVPVGLGVVLILAAVGLAVAVGLPEVIL